MSSHAKTVGFEKRYIKYRKDVCSDDIHATGYEYTLGREGRRNENQLNSTIHWMPRELLIEIMLHFKPEELFLFRQTCSLFFHLSLRAAFSENYDTAEEKQTPAWKPSGLERLFRSLFDLQVRRQVPAFKTFRLQDDGKKTLKELRHRHRLCLCQGLCQECRKRKDSSTEKQPARGPEASATRLLYCHYCDAMHKESWFSVNRYQNGRRVCIGWEGSVRICSHHDMSWSSLISSQMATRGTEVDQAAVLVPTQSDRCQQECYDCDKHTARIAS
ncbi:hypothetical protein CcaCcLH18_02710 [Colletotrichum camelliae]|nr:hypothetical protein CcaCcLH18_02710 [Colletotrichum camelliae]